MTFLSEPDTCVGPRLGPRIERGLVASAIIGKGGMQVMQIT